MGESNKNWHGSEARTLVIMMMVLEVQVGSITGVRGVLKKENELERERVLFLRNEEREDKGGLWSWFV